MKPHRDFLEAAVITLLAFVAGLVRKMNPKSPGEHMTKGKNGKSKDKEKKIKQAHPFGPPDQRAKGFNFPSPNPTLFVHAGKPATNLPENLRQVFEAIGKHANGVALKDRKVANLGEKTLQWLVRQLAKHEYVRAKAEDKPESKKTTKKEGQK